MDPQAIVLDKLQDDINYYGNYGKQFLSYSDIKTLFNNKKLFKLYRDTNLSIRGIAKETGISFVSIFHTLKKSKGKLKDMFGEDYLDYKNEDYERI